MIATLPTSSPSAQHCPICDFKVDRVYSDFPGYIQSETFDIYHCTGCSTSFAWPMESRYPIYELIYKYASSINGYNEYSKLAKDVRLRQDPLSFLTKWSSTYWGVAKAVSQFPPNANVRILEVGSGLGYLTYALSQHGYNVVGLDISERAVKQATKAYGNLYKCADLRIFAEEHAGEFDAVIMTEIIEHVPNIFELILAAKRCLKKSGKIIITTPNTESLPNNALWISDAPPVHYWSFSSTSFKAIGAKAGCDVDFIDLTPSGLDRPLASFVAMDHSKPLTSPVFNAYGQPLIRRTAAESFRQLVEQALSFIGLLFYIRHTKATLNKLNKQKPEFGPIPNFLCAQFTIITELKTHGDLANTKQYT